MGSPPRRMLALGDSYTIGEAVPPAGRWVAMVAAGLRAVGISLEPPEIVAQTGWTTDELEAAIVAAGTSGSFDLVTLMVGVNDQFRGRDLARFRARYAGLLERAVGFAGGEPGHVLAISIPDWGVTPFARARAGLELARTVDDFNDAAASEALSRAVRWVDVTRASRELSLQPGMLAGDGLHPSASQHAAWAAIILPEARRALAPSRAHS